MDKTKKLRRCSVALSNLQHSHLFLTRSRDNTKTCFEKTHINNKSLYTRADGADEYVSKASRLQGLLNRTRSVVARSRRPVQRETAAMAGGWCNCGFPKPTVYRVEDLVSYWRACMLQKFQDTTPPLSFPFFMRPKILEWLRADGHVLCERIVAYGVKMWEPLKQEFEIDADYPTMNIMWGFRRVLYKRMQQTGEKRRWGGNWHGEAGEQYHEEVS